MPRFAANLTMMFNEVPFLERFEAAARAGFEAVEFLFPYDHPPEEVAARLRAGGLRNVLFNMPPGDWSGVVPPGADRARHRAAYLENLRHAARETARRGITLLVEPINTRDIPGYFLNTQAEAHALREEVGAENLAVQMDLYHAQIVEGDVTTKLRRYVRHVGHVQIAGVPERNEPDTGELDHRYLFRVLDDLGYQGWVGCEYRPARGTVEGLGWFAPYRRKA